MSDNTTSNRRVQRFLDAAEKHGWTVNQPDPESSTWLVYPHSDHTEGFVVHDLPNDAVRVLRADAYKPVTQKEALATIEAHHHDPTPKLGVDDIEVSTRRIDSGGTDVIVEAEFSLPLDLDPKDRAEFSEGALLAATTIANLLDRSTAFVVGMGQVLSEDEGDDYVEQAVLSPTGAAHSYLHLAAQVRDPRTLKMIFKDRPEPSAALTAGAKSVCKSLVLVWTTFADGLFELDPEMGAPLKEFLGSIREHAEFIRQSADEVFGDGVTFTDHDFEELLK